MINVLVAIYKCWFFSIGEVLLLYFWNGTPSTKANIFSHYYTHFLSLMIPLLQYFISYSKVVNGQRGSHYIDGANESLSNWLRYVNCARTKSEQNLEAFQYKDNIYYKTLRDIRPGIQKRDKVL